MIISLPPRRNLSGLDSQVLLPSESRLNSASIIVHHVENKIKSPKKTFYNTLIRSVQPNECNRQFVLCTYS